jgi:DNA topoisomerase-1
LSTTRKLVIVESPAKAKTIGKYLGGDYSVLASVGHIRDLTVPADLPAAVKTGYMKAFGVDVDNKFTPHYTVSEYSKKTVAELKRALKEADELYLATDEDREGEAIAWHLLEVLKPKVPVRRMVFHEITKEAIEAARENTREVDMDLVEAQETRRILDRLYGYAVSPVLWRMVGRGLSAGRVQSVATRLVVDREKERMAFRTAGYWDLLLTVGTSSDIATQFECKLKRVGGKTIAEGSSFDSVGALRAGKNDRVLTEAEAQSLVGAIATAGTPITVTKMETKPYTKRPAAPFTTSTLQQEAIRKLRFSSKQTMSIAQRLYENGYITYMRTDSPALSAQAIAAARAQATAMYGADQVADAPRIYAGKNKNAQEAHEAVRPAGDSFKTPAELSSVLRGEDLKLYELIWKRTVASQMADAKGQTATVTVEATPAGAEVAEFSASGTVITFRGFLNAYEETIEEDVPANDTAEDAKLPAMTEGQSLVLADVEAKGHETQPPARYTEASLVKKMEEIGIGRPSTYAATIGTIQERGYVRSRGQAMVPTWIAFTVNKLMEASFNDLVSYDFTAEMEDDLDHIADGKADGASWLQGFFFGKDAHPGLERQTQDLGDLDKRTLNSVTIGEYVLRIWPTNQYVEVADEDAGPDAPPRKVYVPDDMAPDELTEEKIRELIDAPVAGDRVLGVNPDNGKEVLAKDGRFGPYVTERTPEADLPVVEPEILVDTETGEVIETKPKKKAKVEAPKERTASLFKTMDPSAIDLEIAQKLLNLPREVGVDPESGTMITSQNGRYGAYLKKGTDTRSLNTEQEIFDITLEGALERFAQPKYGARSASAALAEFDADPVSGKPVKIKDGRFGAYVTDGETNATIPRTERVEDVNYDRAIELLAEKRAKGPAPKRGRAVAKKPAAKKPAAKKTAVKKTTATKTAAKKSAATKTGIAKSPATGPTFTDSDSD